MEAKNIKSMRFDGDGIFEITCKPSGKKYLIYNKKGLHYFPCQSTLGIFNCNKAVATEDMKIFCMDPNFSNMHENVSKDDADKYQKLTGKKLKNFVFSQMKEYKVHCMNTGDET